MKACERCGVVRVPVFVDRSVCRSCEPVPVSPPLPRSVVQFPSDAAHLQRQRARAREYREREAQREAAWERVR